MSLIQVINPNTSLAMTETIGAAARAVAAPATEIIAVSMRRSRRLACWSR